MARTCPYRELPPTALWKESVAHRAVTAIAPFAAPAPPIPPAAKVASAGSCFAQRLAEHLPRLGLCYHVTEPGPAFLHADDRRPLGYGIYSARYGNVYTALQLAQLLERALGTFAPDEPVWRNDAGRFVDPFRPGVHGRGFRSEDECLADRQVHLRAVRELFTTADVFLFTLGLTEAWVTAGDGACLPMCPGCGSGGVFDPERHRFQAFRVREVVAHLDRFLRTVATVNPKLRVILSVSPVPLVATMRDEHVLTATMASKAVLRAAVDEVRLVHGNVEYFAAYELIQAGGPEWAFAKDRRSVTPQAVAHVVDCFTAQFLGQQRPGSAPMPADPVRKPVAPSAPLCDEETLLAALARDRSC